MRPLPFTEGPIVTLFTKHTVPMLLGLLAHLLMQALDVWFISQLGTEALSAIGFVFPVTMLFVYLAIGLSAGVASVVARKAATLPTSALNRLICDSQCLAMLIGVVLIICCLVLSDAIFYWMGAPEELIPMIQSYLRLFYINGFLTIAGMVGLSTIRALGNTQVQGVSMLIAALVHAVLDPLFIFGVGHIDGLGLQGAAAAGAIAKCLPFLMAWFALKQSIAGGVNRFSPADFKRSLRAIFYVALPSVGNNLAIPISAFFVTKLLSTYGETAVAGFAIPINIEPMLLLIFHALSSVVGPFMGQNYSMAYFSRIGEATWRLCLFCLLFGFVSAGLLWLSGGRLAYLFTQDESVLKIAQLYFIWVPVSFGFSGIIIVINSSFNGIGKPMPATSISLLRTLILYLPAIYLGSQLDGVRGILIAGSVVNIVCAVIALVWFQRTIRYEKSLSLKSE